MARTEQQLRDWYGPHPEGGRRCDDAECTQCEFRDLFAEIDRLRAEVEDLQRHGPTDD